MKFGFIGAGKVGFSLGKFFATHGLNVVGYLSSNEADAREAASFTRSKAYTSLEDLVNDCDIIFITVPDGEITNVWNQLNTLEFKNKIVCHASGALSSEVFSGIDNHESYGYSIHPLFAFNNPFEAYKELSNIYFTIEGHEAKLKDIIDIFDTLGLKTRTIKTEDKVLYHAAAAMASNLVVGLIDSAESIIPHEALIPIMQANMNHIVEAGTEGALTGPIERNDVDTVKKHLEVLKGDQLTQYVALSRQVLEVAKRKHPYADYSSMKSLLDSVN